MMANYLFDLKEEEIEAYENNIFVNDFEEVRVPIHTDKDEVHVFIGGRLIFGNGKYCLLSGVKCYIEEGLPLPDCNIYAIWKNSEKLDYKNPLYCEMQSSLESTIHNFHTLISNVERTRNIAARDTKAAANHADRHTHVMYA